VQNGPAMACSSAITSVPESGRLVSEFVDADFGLEFVEESNLVCRLFVERGSSSH
jgi:hypothetical protein